MKKKEKRQTGLWIMTQNTIDDRVSWKLETQAKVQCDPRQIGAQKLTTAGTGS